VKLRGVDPQPRWPTELTAPLRRADPVRVFLESPAIAAIRRDARPLTERQYCEHVVAFANDGQLSTEKWFELLGGAATGDDDAIGNRAPAGRVVEGLTTLIRQQLAELVQHRARASRLLGPWWADFAATNGLVTLPVCEFQDNGSMTVQHRLLAGNLVAGIAYGMCLLLDDQRPHGEMLWRCRLETCGRFFFEQPRTRAGRPRREYCKKDHLKEAHRLQVLERVRRHRRKPK
jgi:hypothetical protein